MPKARITRSSIDKLEVVLGRQVKYFDTKLTGFGVLVSQDSRTYFVQTRIKGQRTKGGREKEVYESIGRTDVVPYEKALDRVKIILDDAAQGIAPYDKRVHKANLEAQNLSRKMEELKKDITLQEMFQEYTKTRKKLKATTIELYQEDIDRYLPDWKDRALRSITGSDIIKQHAIIGQRSKARADGVMRVLRAVFNHAMHMYDDIILKNPVQKLSAVSAWYNVSRKETYLRPADLKTWLPAVMKLEYDTSKDYILMMLFQGSRRTETSTLKWKDVNLTLGTAKFRETKTGVALEVPLSRFILDRLEDRMKYYYDGPESFVFPSYGKSGHIEDVRVALKMAQDASGVYLSHHDLRRSFISYCEELEINIFSRKRLANHAIPLDVTEGYTLFNMERLRVIIEKIAKFILDSAGIPYQIAEAPPISMEQASKIAGTEFWQSLSPEQQASFMQMMDTKKPPQGDKVISLEAEKVRRRMAIR